MEKSILNNLSSQLCNEQYSDIKFRVQNRIFPAHKCILVQSEYFKTLFLGSFTEQNKEIIDLEEILADDFKIILESLYGITPNFKTLECEKTIDILLMAKYFLIDDLVSIVTGHVKQTVNEENILKVFEIAYSNSIDELLNYCIDKFINWDPMSILRHPDINDLSPGAMKALISLDTLCASEIEIFNSVKTWIDNNPDASSNEDMMSLIRWNRVSDTDFVKVVYPSKLLTDSKILQLMLQNKSPSNAVGRYWGIKDYDLCEGLELDIITHDYEDGFPNLCKQFQMNKALFATVTFDEPCLINFIQVITDSIFDYSDFRLCIDYSDNAIELDELDKLEWKHMVVLDESYYEKYFPPTQVKQIRICVLQITDGEMLSLLNVGEIQSHQRRIGW